YTIVDDGEAENADKNMLHKSSIEAKFKAGSTAVYKGREFNFMVDDASVTGVALDGVDDSKPQVITADTAYDKIAQELRLASSVGATNTSASNGADDGTGVGDGTLHTTGTGTDAGKIIYELQKGTVDRKEGLTFSLHVGADADMTNKISVQIDALDTAGLGIAGLNVKDSTGASATYAIDAIADAVAHVSAQRSLLGAVQNRLEHTINNLDNVVENTTAAESQIRDTDMATEMVKYSNANILSQAGQSMLAQGNQANQGVLSLLG
ncbi:MAG: flagellar hook protein, partial [Lachnospiraceae bacterium]|nr:flagellar hook protein [Lachnospiraceae bacterium]